MDERRTNAADDHGMRTPRRVVPRREAWLFASGLQRHQSKLTIQRKTDRDDAMKLASRRRVPADSMRGVVSRTAHRQPANVPTTIPPRSEMVSVN